MRRSQPSVFLSHTHSDKQFARRLYADLTAHGANVWFDEAEINVGDSLIEKIREGIDKVDYLAVILSPRSVQSEWVKREVNIAINQEIEGKRIKVLPLMLEKCNLPGFLIGKLYADFTSPENYTNAFALILKRLGVTASPHKELPEVLPPKTTVSHVQISQDAYQRLEHLWHKTSPQTYWLNLGTTRLNFDTELNNLQPCANCGHFEGLCIMVEEEYDSGDTWWTDHFCCANCGHEWIVEREVGD